MASKSEPQGVPEPMRWLSRVSADLLKAFAELRLRVQEGGRLSVREKRLALTAAYASIGCVKCLAGCIREGLKEGLSIEELLEAASVAVLARGAEAVVTVSEVLRLLGIEA